MNDQTRSLIRLMSWLSPVFPTGGFAYSAGLEQAVADGTVRRGDDLHRWIADAMVHGTLWNDAVLLAEAHRGAGNAGRIAELSALCLALASSAERHREARDQGAAFLDAAAHWFGAGALPPRETPLPVAVGVVTGRARIEADKALAAWLNTFATNQLQCAIRLSVIGQSGAAAILARIEPVVAQCARQAAAATLDDLGASAFGADIACQRHQMLQPRLFMS
ncbi:MULTISPECIES: urease accessory UreF family protein [unclassified Roseitalea]|uniref:urease accessory protein UreF n=1 Tax=unclassified Roseitalea TaxID=2639107 RepID=UPI00273EE20D|nr:MULTISPECIES: urease accessory UreF family protein [unclassified Roseitalea]